MGGAKKPAAAGRDSNKAKESTGPKRAEITVMVNEQQGAEIVRRAKVITAQDLARQLGIKASACNAFLLGMVEKGLAKRVGGYSGHRLYQAVSE